MPFWPKNYKESLMKKIKSPLLGEVEKDAAKEDLKFFKSMLTDRVTTYGVKDIRLEKKRKISISNQKTLETKQTDQMPSSSLSLTNFVSDSSDDKLDDDNEDEDFKPQKPITKKYLQKREEI